MAEISPEELNRILRAAAVPDSRIIDVVQDALWTQNIVVPIPNQTSTIFAGGTNLCPNSDFAYSYLAATTPGTLPGDAGATNLEVYRVTRQVKDANISTQRLRTVESDAWIPNWDRVRGLGCIGWDGGSGDNYDIAFQLNNNWLQPNRKWYIRVAVATADATPLPVGSRIYAGFWVKRTGGSQGWVDGNNFELEYKIFGLPGSNDFDYFVLAKTDSGVTLASQVLNVPNAPDTLDRDNYIRISYPGAAGFIEFDLYRRDNGTGLIHKVAHDRNSEKLWAFDLGATDYPVTDFPTAELSNYRAYAEFEVDAVSIDQQKTFNNLAVIVPANFDTSDVVTEGTYLRIGMTAPVTSNRQVLLDTIWAAETYNTWGPSSFDNYPSPPSTTMTSGPPVGGGGTGGGPPSGGGSACLSVEHSLKLADGSWVPLGVADTLKRCESGLKGSGNAISHFIDGEVSQYYVLTFDCGLVIRTSLTHRFIRSFKDNSGITVEALMPGDTIQGGKDGRARKLRLETKVLVAAPAGKHLIVRAVKLAEESTRKFYAAGDPESGWYVYSHNTKRIDDPVS